MNLCFFRILYFSLMTQILYRKISRIYLVGILIFFIACSSETEKKVEVEDQQLSVTEEEMQLLEVGLHQLQTWREFWRTHEATFASADFVLDRTDTFEQLEWPEENYIVSGSPFHPYLLANPEGKGQVDIYSYKIVYPESGGPFLNPDSEVIYFKNNGMRERLLFMGPSGIFEDAVWVSSDHLLVAGFFESDAGITPKIWLIDTEDYKLTVFKNSVFTTKYPKEGYLRKKLKTLNF